LFGLARALASASPRFERVCVLADDETAALTLVRTGLRLEDQPIHIVRTLSEKECKAIDLKPFQVKHV
jgi:hypothetical protein